MITVAHNLSAMNAQRQFGINTKSKAKSTERLLSGYKINRAADDAAGLSISEKMRRQIRGLTQGVENTQDGVSLCQVADGALAEVNDMLHRITELSVKSANGTNSEQDRQYIQNEINEILQEIDRVSDTTCFNELHIFKEEKAPSVEAPSTPIITPPSTPSTGTTPAVDYETLIRDSLVVSGTPSNIAKGTYTIAATDQGMTINGTSIAWSEVKDTNGNAMDVNSIAEGKYQFEYNGLIIAYEANAGATLDDVINAVDGTEFQVSTRNTTQDAVTITNIAITPGTKTDELLSGNPLLGGKTAYIEADADKFKLKGNVTTAIRSDEDIKCIDKSQAEIVFKTQKKRLDEFLKTYGFIKYKGRAYVRWNKIDVLEYIDVQKERYGSKTFTVNYSLIPLYVPHDFLSFDLGDRLGVLIAGKDVWWDYSEEKIADISFSNVIDAISDYLLPWFEKNSHRDVLQKSLLKEKEKRESHGGRLSDTQQLWVCKLMEPANESIVQENIRVFNLPAKLQRENGSQQNCN